MATLGTTFAGVYLAMPAKTKEKESGPPINAASKDEEKFIQYAFLKIAMSGIGQGSPSSRQD